MTKQNSQLDKKLAQLKLTYAENLPQKIGDISGAWQKIIEDWKKTEAEEVYRAIHSLCGSSGSYGAAAVNKHARGLEKVILTLIYEERLPRDEDLEEFEKLLRRTKKAANNWILTVQPDVSDKGSTDQDQKSKNIIFVLDGDEFFVASLVGELKNNQFLVRTFVSKLKFMEACQLDRPELIVMDSKFALGSGPGADTLDDLKKVWTLMPQVFFVSTTNDVQARLDSVRTGARQYFLKPVDLNQLVESIDASLTHEQSFMGRVLIVDDDMSVSELHASALEHAGFETKTQTDPLKALDDLASFTPDLVLMDVHMPGCSGLELAAVIRQDTKFDDVIILFLSADPETERHLKSLQLVREELLMKPVEPEWLVQIIEARVGRKHQLQSAKSELRTIRNEKQFRELALDQHAIVSIANAEGVITYVNTKFCEISGYSKEELIGQDHNIVNSGFHSKDFFEEMWTKIVSGKVWHGEIHNLTKNGKIYWVASTIVPFLDADGLPYQYVSMRTDVTKIKTLELEVSRHDELLSSLHAAMTGFMSAGQFNNVVALLLDKMIRLTGSDYGIMAEVLFDNDEPFLKTHAIKNVNWDEKTQAKFDHQYQNGSKLKKQYSILSAVCNSGEVIISEDLNSDPLGSELPGDDSKPNKFLGVPVYYGDQLVGIYAFARRDKSYSSKTVSLLDAFNATYGVMIHAKRIAEMEEEVNIFLDQARQEAETANKAKSEFLSSMSHELRTPLNVILGFAQLMLADTEHELPMSQKENADEILRAGHHLLDLVNEVLDLSRIEAGLFDLNIQPAEIEAVVGDCVGLVRTLADNKNIKIEYIRGECTTKKVAADVTRLNQALINFLSNAVKYTPKNGEVAISCAQVSDGFLRVIVTDTGPGIQPEYHDQIFTPFNRLGAQDGEEEGTGIGLVITKNIIEKMGGSVGYSDGENGGASFWLELPLDRSLESSTDFLDKNEQNEVREVMENYEPETQYKILYIEDNLANLNLVKQLLNRRPNVELLTADEPEQGLRLIESNQLDTVLLDINLPIMSGYEVLAKIRENDRTKNLPVIAVSANAMPSDIENGLEAGFDDYITKPIQLDQFFAVLDRVLADQ